MLEWAQSPPSFPGADVRMPRRALLSVAIVAVLAAALAGCSRDAVNATGQPARLTARISGSGTCTPLLRLLTDTYDGTGVEWRYLPGLHSGGGITGCAKGELDIGAVSRPLSAEEEALGLTYTPISTDGVVIAVHPSVTIRGLSTEQVRGIYAGDYSNWQELGGPDLPITVLDRNEDESAKIVMRQYVLGDVAISPKAVGLYYEVDMVQGVESTVGAIGYFSLGHAVSNDIPVTLLELDGVAPTVENIRNGSYRVVRPLGVVTPPDAGPEIDAFLEWATSDTAAALIESNGFAAAR